MQQIEEKPVLQFWRADLTLKDAKSLMIRAEKTTNKQIKNQPYFWPGGIKCLSFACMSKHGLEVESLGFARLVFFFFFFLFTLMSQPVYIFFLCIPFVCLYFFHPLESKFKLHFFYCSELCCLNFLCSLTHI